MAVATGKVQVLVSRTIHASASQVYAYIADYREHHPNFLPGAFSNLTIERGGVGGGTVVSFDLRLAGRTSRIRTIVDEPDPGRVLKEISLDSDSVTTFEVIPNDAGSLVTIHTEWTPEAGAQGWIERRLAVPMLRQLYRDELTRLDRYARRHHLVPHEPEMSGVSG